MKTRFFVLVFFLALSPFAHADIFKVIGIPDTMSMDDLINEFSKKGIKPTGAMVPGVANTDARLAQIKARHDVILRDLDLSKFPVKCLTYENSLEPRDDIVQVSICYAGQYQVAIMPMFKGGKKKAFELGKILVEKYGKSEEVEDEYTSALLWVDRPVYHLKTIPKRYIYFEKELFGPMLTYINYWQILQMVKQIDDEAETNAEGF